LTSPLELTEAAADESSARRLIAVAAFGAVATITGTVLFAYPITFGAPRIAIVVVHNLSGDLLVLAGVAYLIVHLRRTWRMRGRALSRWTGYAAVAGWTIAGLTGIYGQAQPIPSGSTLSSLHVLSSLALIVLACFHGAWGFIRRERTRDRS
jgi:hypothetical protein